MIGIRGSYMLARNTTSWAIRIRIEHNYLVSDGPRRDNKHAPKLTTAEYTERAIGEDRHLSLLRGQGHLQNGITLT